MKINISNAIKEFHPNCSFEQIYLEAIANSFDAKATNISIDINIKSYKEPETLKIRIKDNGLGFTDERFAKFSKLLETQDRNHKGLGRLVYLAYFREIRINSLYEGQFKRSISFTENFEPDRDSSLLNQNGSQGTELEFKNYKKTRIYSYDFLIPEDIKNMIINHFLVLLYRFRVIKRKFHINIILKVREPNVDRNFVTSSCSIDENCLPDLDVEYFSVKNIDMFSEFRVLYNISKDPSKSRRVSVSLAVDDRGIEYHIIDDEQIPHGYQAVFIIDSQFLEGKSDSSRQNLLLNDVDQKALKKEIKKTISKILNEKIPSVASENQKLQSELDQKYPHLKGYFDDEYPGLQSKSKLLEDAQQKFISEQQIILECSEMNLREYEKAIELSSRVLLEYVLYRQKIINRLKNSTASESERFIHELIVPKGKHESKTNENFTFQNNIWILDDKFMSYNVVLSEQRLNNLLESLELPEESGYEGRPDISLVFSKDPESSDKFDVVVIELKKKGLDIHKNQTVIGQLKERARRLLEHFPTKIDRIWFYGITDISEEFGRSMREDGYKELFSLGRLFYNSQKILYYTQEDPAKELEGIADIFIMSYDALAKDAESRNGTFLNLLKDTIKNMIEKKNKEEV